MVMPYHLHMPSYFLETFTEYPYNRGRVEILLFPKKLVLCLWIGECNIHRFCSLCVYTMPCTFKKK